MKKTNLNLSVDNYKMWCRNLINVSSKDVLFYLVHIKFTRLEVL